MAINMIIDGYEVLREGDMIIVRNDNKELCWCKLPGTVLNNLELAMETGNAKILEVMAKQYAKLFWKKALKLKEKAKISDYEFERLSEDIWAECNNVMILNSTPPDMILYVCDLCFQISIVRALLEYLMLK